jgi:predicted transcriptional regulator
MQTYTEGDVLLILKILQNQQTGRKALSTILGLGEATVRTLFRKLESDNLITSTRQGQSITQKGIDYLSQAPEFTLPRSVTVGEITLSKHSMASLVSNFSHHIKNGIKIRDAALISGASGATTLLYKNRGFVFPHGTSPLPPSIEEYLIREFSPSEHDVLIISTADTERQAIRGISGCLSLLLRENDQDL